MTTPNTGPGVNPLAPQVSVTPSVACSAGVGTVVQVYVRHPGPRPARMTVLVHGLDPGWVPPPVVVELQPGEATTLALEIFPAQGALGARYPFVVAVESLDPLGTTGPVMSTAESILAVGVRERAIVVVEPVQITAIFGRKVNVRITNPSHEDRELTIRPTVPQGVSLRLDRDAVHVAAGRTVSVRGKIKVRRPRVFGTVEVHTYAVAVRGQGAPVVVEGTVRARPLLRGAFVRVMAAVVVVALWAGLAVVAIPRITDYFTTDTSETAAQTAEDVAGADGGAAGDGTADGSGDGAAADGQADGDGADGEPGADGDPAAAATGERLRGLVTGQDPGGVAVILAPTSLVEAAAVGAEAAEGVTDEATASGLRAAAGAFGKTPSSALRLARAEDPPEVETETADDGTFSMAGIRAPGFYLLTFARAGYQTQRFVVNSATLADADPLEVQLVAGQGQLSGLVNSSTGPVGAATVSITDGTVSFQTSSVSPGGDGTPGTWNVSGLSTPGTYLVSASSPGFGTASSLVTLDAGGSGAADLTLVAGVAAITGQVSGEDQLGQLGGVGGISVSVTGQSGDVTTTRNATTVTSGPVGRFTLPDLPTPGEYTLTVSGAGWQDQVRQISLAAGAGAANVDISLTRADGVVTGTVSGDPAANGKPAEGGVAGAGLTLTGPEGAIKTMTTSDPPGAFRFTGVPPGVYVLTGTMFGRVPSSVTVEVTAAGDAVANLTLISSADTELPATAHIQGRAVDARTGSTLNCDRAPTPGEDCLLTASVMVPVIDPVTGRIEPNAPMELISGTYSPAEDYVLPELTDTKHPGLVPGLYTVNLTAPGYEPGSTSVQVAQGQTATAAQVSLAPLGMISGRITTRAGTPVGDTCVVVYAAGTPAPPAASTCVGNTDGVTCLVGSDPTVRCGLVQDDQTYEVRGLVHGGYTVIVIPTDREYIPPAPFNLTLELASDATYDPVLDRRGRISVRVLTPDDTAELVPVKDAEVLAKIGTTTSARAISDANGAALLVGLGGPDGQDLRYALSATGVGGSAVIAEVPVQLNITVDVTMVLVEKVGIVVGRVVTNDGGPQPFGLNGVRVRVTGITGYSGITPITGFAEIVTDSNGCFMILPDRATLPPTGAQAPCPAEVAVDSQGTMNVADAFLVARPVSVFVPETTRTQGPVTVNVSVEGDGTVRSIPVTTVLPKPSDTTGLKLSSNPTTGPPSPLREKATITVLTKPPGAGQVGIEESITPAGVSTLTWTDPAVGPSNLAAPGKYTIQASLPGWSTVTGTVICPLGLACAFDSAGFTIVRNPTFVASVSVLPTGSADPSQASYSVLTGPTPLPSITLTANSSGVLTWAEAGAPVGLIRPGPYRIGATLGGFESQPIEFTCGAGPGTCTPPSPPGPLTLSRPAQTTIELRSTGAVAAVGATVQLTGKEIGTRNLTAAADSTFIELPSLSTFDTSYKLQIKAAGFATTNVDLNSTNTQCTGPAGPTQPPFGLRLQPGDNDCVVTIQQLGRIPLRTWQSSPGADRVALSSVTVRAVRDGGGSFTITTGADGTGLITGTLAQEGLIDGTYTVTATKAGYDQDEATVVISNHQIDPSIPGDVLTLTLPARPVVMPVQLISNGVAILPPGTITVRGNSITRTCTLVITAAVAACDPADANTTVINGAGAKVNFADLYPAVYTVSFESTDSRYRSQQVQVQLNAAAIAPPVILTLDLRASTQPGVVQNSAGTALPGAQVSLRYDLNVETIVKDIDGVDLVAVADTNGAFTFNKVPDGFFRIMVDANGWNRFFSNMITMNSQITTTPPSVTLRPTTRITRGVILTLDSTADAAKLAGASVTFQPVPNSQPSGTLPVNGPLSSLTVSSNSPYTVTAPQVPTGSWTAVVSPASGTAFGPFTTTSFSVPDPPRPTPALPPDTNPPSDPVEVSKTLQLGSATITINWSGCSDVPATGTLPIRLTKEGVNADLAATVTAGADPGAGSATVTVLIPPGDYTWVPTLTGGWTGGNGSFTMPATGAPPVTVPPTLTATLVPPQVPVTSTLAIDDNRVLTPTIAALPPGGGAAVPPDGTDAAGVVSFCLAPGTGWTFRVRDTSTTPQLLVPDQTYNVTRGTNAVNFTGFTFTPTISLAAVAGRTPDTTSRAVALALTLAGASVWTDTATIPANGTSVVGPSVIIGGGTYSLTATPGGSFFGPATIAVNANPTPTPTVTLPYTAVILTATAQVAGANRAGAVITLAPAAGTGVPAITGANGQMVFQDIPPGIYTVTATVTVATVVTFRGSTTTPNLAAGVRAATVTMTAVPPPPPPGG